MIRPTNAVGEAMMQLLVAYTNYKDPLGPGVAIQRNGAVKDFFVESGTVSFEVYDGRDRAFDVEIHVSPPSENVRRAVHSGDIQDAVPKVGEINVHHICPEWASPCRHEIAAFLQLVKEVDEDHNALLKWRGIGDNKVAAKKTKEDEQSLNESEKKTTIRNLRKNLPGRFITISDSKNNDPVLLDEEMIDFFSFSQKNKDSFTLTRINKTNSMEEEQTEIKFDGFNIGNVFTDAIETITEFVLKN